MKINIEYESFDEMFAGAAALTAAPSNPQVTKLMALAKQLGDSAVQLSDATAKLKAALTVSFT